LSESNLYKELGILTKRKDQWEENIPYISSLLSHDSVTIQAEALWLLAEMGLAYLQSVRDAVPAIVCFRTSCATASASESIAEKDNTGSRSPDMSSGRRNIRQTPP
jgi:hypothetical protein